MTFNICFLSFFGQVFYLLYLRHIYLKNANLFLKEKCGLSDTIRKTMLETTMSLFDDSTELGAGVSYFGLIYFCFCVHQKNEWK
jgi:hypothetical protein